MAHEQSQSAIGSSYTQVIPVVMGMLGMSIEDIDKGTKGYVKLPVGPRDPIMAGGRKWVKLKVTAMEDVRAFRDIIVGNDQGEVKEHTPVELSYEKHIGGYQRVGEDNPLPMTMGSRAISYVTLTCTTLGNTELIPAPNLGKKIRVVFIGYSNTHGAMATVGIRFSTLGTVIQEYGLAPSGGNVTGNLTDCCVEGTDGQPLEAWLSAGYAGGVIFNVGYVIVDV